MADQLVRSGRKPRADAQRNRERLLEAATQVFNQGGAEASLEAVARQAEVGIGTLYRHFPTREALFEAVYRREVQQLAALAEQLESEAAPPVEAVRRWVHALIGFVAVKKGMSAALAVVAQSSSNLAACMLEQMASALDRLLRRAVAAGEVRGDIGAEEVLRALVGMCYMHDTPDWRRNVLRTADVFIDGLRYAARDQRPAGR